MYRVTVSLWPDETRVVRGDELVDLQRQGLIVGDPVAVDDVPAEEADKTPATKPDKTDTPSKTDTPKVA